MRHELLKSKVDDFYKSMSQTPDVKDYSNFEFGKDGQHLHLKTDKGTVQLTNHNNPSKFLKLSTIKSKIGTDGIRRHLSLSDYSSSMSKKAVTTLQNIQQTIPNLDIIEMENLGDATEQIVDNGQQLETSLSEVMNTVEHPPLPMREILALNQTLQTIKGELLNNLSKLSRLDEDIERAKTTLADMDDGNFEGKQRIEQKLRDLHSERLARLEVIKTNRKLLSSQVNRMKETIESILYENTTLAERIKTLFREQGVTIATLITAFGFCISTLVLSLSGGGSGLSVGSGNNNDPGFVKKQLLKLKELLLKLGSKAIDALPGIIGSIVGWLFKTAGEAVNYIAEHIWLLFLFFVAGLFEMVKKK
jgi:predicted  nucleic acid-binding Zn-ribbon protein